MKDGADNFNLIFGLGMFAFAVVILLACWQCAKSGVIGGSQFGQPVSRDENPLLFRAITWMFVGFAVFLAAFGIVVLGQLVH